ncbi:S1 family peptidase [Rhodococcus sp. NPDC049939]|uniref:S1 family peptidase n=1 Tax=Rhodococcus sp. NPDC049939 TaxID=3155511 RepID=UPI0033CAC2F2
MSITRKITAATAVALTISSVGFGVASAAPADEKAASAGTPVGPGTEITVEMPDGSWSGCTVAFTGTTPSNEPVALTAGHCAFPGMRIYADGKLIGETDKSSLEEEWDPISPDWATIALNENAQPVAASDKVAPESVGVARLGDEVCSDGKTSGWQCGVVTAITGDWIWHNLVMAPGDSGAPLIRTSDNAALGIHSARGDLLPMDYGRSYSLAAALTKAGGYELTTVNGPAPAPETSPLGSLGSS